MASKSFVTLFVLLSVFVSCFAVQVERTTSGIDVFHPHLSIRPLLPATVRAEPGADECKLCINIAVEMINVLLNIILNGGIIGDCGNLCGKLNNTIEADICAAMCDVVGLDEFVKILEKFSNDIDPIYFCQLVFMCEVQDCTGNCASIDNFVIDPQIGNIQTTFYINTTLSIYQPIGAGVIDWTWTDVEDPKLSTGYQALMTSFQPGTFLLSLQEYPDGYGGLSPGNYTVDITVCEGVCGATFPHTAVLATAQSWMLITD